MKCRAQVVKNRLGPPLRHADYIMYFDSGIDDYGSWLTVMKEHNHNLVNTSLIFQPNQAF